MKKYEILVCGYRVEVNATAYHTAIARALRFLKRRGILKENSRSVRVEARCLGSVVTQSEASR